jgi:hypothetical protein
MIGEAPGELVLDFQSFKLPGLVVSKKKAGDTSG